MLDFYITAKERGLRILQLTDMQIIDSAQCRYVGRLNDKSMMDWDISRVDENLFYDMDRLVKETNPDLIIITGDIVYGEFDDRGTTMLLFIEKMESYGIPWAPVWGNHDNETKMTVDWQIEQLKKAEHCLFKKGTVTGTSNYTIGICNQNGDVIRVVYMLDSNGCGFATDASVAQGVKRDAGFDVSQLNWIETVHKKVWEKYSATPSFACFHIPPLDLMEIFENRGWLQNDDYLHRERFKPYKIKGSTVEFGGIGEAFCPFPLRVKDSFKRAEVDGVFFGHDHLNDCSVVEDGIRWTFGVKTGRYDYHSVDKLGGTVIDISPDGKSFKVKHKYISKS